MKKMFPLLMLIFLCGFLLAGSGPQECVVDNEEEYAVIAAVLFPNEPEIPEGMTNDLEQDAYRAFRRIRLDGFHGSSYLIRDASMVSRTTPESDPDFVGDFNRRNSQSCKFIGEKLQTRLGPDEFVRFSRVGESEGDSPDYSSSPPDIYKPEEGGLFGSEIVRLSRPGFDETGIRAVVDADLQAGPEMGVGYRVYLEKSPKSGKWIIAGADKIRVY